MVASHDFTFVIEVRSALLSVMSECTMTLMRCGMQDQTVVSTDVLGYPTSVPVVSGLRGCATNANNKTSDCLTGGGDVVTLTGINFKTPIAISVRDKNCFPSSHPRISDQWRQLFYTLHCPDRRHLPNASW